MALRLLFLVCLVLTHASSLVAASPIDASDLVFACGPQQDPEALARKILSDDNYETKLPKIKKKIAPSSELNSFWGADIFELAWMLFRILGLAALGIVLFFILKNSGVLDRYYNAAWRPSRAGTMEEKANVDLESFLDVSLEAVRKLADQGNYGQAIHLLLLQTFQELARLAEIQLPKSLTSREILAQVPLPETAQENLGHLIVEVEGSHFGGGEVEESDYDACLNAYDTFLKVVSQELRS